MTDNFTMHRQKQDMTDNSPCIDKKPEHETIYHAQTKNNMTENSPCTDNPPFRDKKTGHDRQFTMHRQKYRT